MCLDCDLFLYCFKCKNTSDQTHVGHKFTRKGEASDLESDELRSDGWKRDESERDVSENDVTHSNKAESD